MNYDFKTIKSRENCLKRKILLWNNPDLSEDIIPFTIADMEFKIAPEINKGLKEFLDEEILGYTLRSDGYYEAVIDWMKTRHGWEIERNWILGKVDIISGLSNAVDALTNEGDGIIVMTPVYNPFYSVIENNKRNIVRNKLLENDGYYTIDFADLEKKAMDKNNKAIILCSPHNPVGRVWRRDELERIGKICLDNNIKIICDEIHHDLIMPAYKHIVLASISKEITDITITCSSATKSFNLAGIPNANVIISNDDLRQLYINKGGHPLGNPLGAKACEIAYRKGEPWLNKLIQVIKDNQNLVKSFFENKYDNIKVEPAEGTYLQWVDFRDTGLNEEHLNKIMEEGQVFFTKGSTYGDEGEGFFRINLACPRKVLEDALNRLDTVFNKYNI